MKINQSSDTELELIAETKSDAELLTHFWIYGIKSNEFTNNKGKISMVITVKNSEWFKND